MKPGHALTQGVVMRSEWQHLYKTANWSRLRLSQLQSHPLCKMHEDLSRIVAATIVDHIVPHKGGVDLFYDADNLQSLCKPCHDRHKQRQENCGVLAGNDSKGMPLDPQHHWNK